MEAPSSRVRLPECGANCRLAAIDDWPERARRAHYSAQALADLCEVTVRTLQRFFLASFGEPPNRQLKCWRMEWARELLRDGKTVKEAATDVFYKSRSHFSREFKKFYGFAPNARVSLPREGH